jgi:tetratricopeptide (TPR) repeat protein
VSHRIRRRASLAIALLLAWPGIPVLPAQSRPTPARTPRMPTSDPQTVRAEYASVLLQAKHYDEAAEEYRRLLAADPGNSAHRLGLVRSLTWGGRHRDAERELDPLLRARPRDAALDSLLRSIRSSYSPRAAEARIWVAERPEYAPYRIALARALVREGARFDEAIAHLDTVVGVNRAPSSEAYRAIGDIHRWNGDLVRARSAYEQARALAPGDRAVATAIVQLAREERPPIAFAPIPTDALGWQVGGETIEDNARLSYATLGVRRGFALDPVTVGSVGAEWRTMAERDSAADSRAAQILAVDVGASRTFDIGQLGARGGLAVHPAGTTVPYGSLSAVAWIWTWNLSLEAAAAPAYPTLLTMASLLPSDAGGGRPLGGRSTTVTLAGPIAAIDLAVSGQITQLSDGNARSTLQAFARHPLDRRWSVVYSASSIRFDERSARYWDPISYTAHSAGIEVGARAPSGFSYSARLLPGVARSVELSPSDAEVPGVADRRYVFQLSTAGEWSYRTARWDVGGGVAYGRGRSDGYQRFGASLTVRLLH